MSSAPSPAEIVADARWLAQALDPATGMLRVVAMTPEAYRAESFLDDRMLQKPHTAGVIPWPSVAGALHANARTDARWVFHIGHVGSTLVARLLGELEGVLGVREPRILRDLAVAPEEQRQPYLGGTQALMSRTFGAKETALVKATSFASEIAAELVPDGGRSLFLTVAPQAYIATILAGENSIKELEMLAGARQRRMTGRVSGLDDARASAAHLAAAAWACEMTALEAAAGAMAGVAWDDFDRMLSDMPAALARAATHFGFETAPEQLGKLAAGPLMRRYSKAPEFDYSPQLRRDLLDEAARAHRADIGAALAMLEQAAAGSPLLERALERSQPES